MRDAAPTYPNEARPYILPRDPAEWIKAIQKLRTEGKSERAIRELTEFRRQYPLYPLPDVLKQLIK